MPADCADGEYCKVANCAAAGGTCTKKPVNDPMPAVVCGCDGVTYWNLELAANFGVSVKGQGVCPGGTAKACSQITDCPAKRFCNYHTTANGAGVCAIQTTGTCWGLPEQCPNDPTPTSRPCGASINTCKSFCEAVKAEQSWVEDVDCN